jgi:hypothetical protein
MLFGTGSCKNIKEVKQYDKAKYIS